MVRTIVDGLRFCQCCLFAALYGDACDCPDEHDGKVTAGLDRLTSEGGHIVPAFDSDTGRGCDEFSWHACDCCRSHDGGSRHEFAILAQVESEDA